MIHQVLGQWAAILTRWACGGRPYAIFSPSAGRDDCTHLYSVLVYCSTVTTRRYIQVRTAVLVQYLYCTEYRTSTVRVQVQWATCTRTVQSLTCTRIQVQYSYLYVPVLSTYCTYMAVQYTSGDKSPTPYVRTSTVLVRTGTEYSTRTYRY